MNLPVDMCFLGFWLDLQYYMSSGTFMFIFIRNYHTVSKVAEAFTISKLVLLIFKALVYPQVLANVCDCPFHCHFNEYKWVSH